MKKIISIIGICVSICMIVCGIFAVTGNLAGSTSYGGSSPYNSGYASFGADYYTYSVNNAAETASAAKAVANNTAQILEFLELYGGLLMMLAGAVSLCAFGINLASCMTSLNIIDTDEVFETSDNTDDVILSSEMETDNVTEEL